jgi:hypothetical protein
MPANPRLIKRVANAWGDAARGPEPPAPRPPPADHEPHDVLVRAAILFVRFPTLVDDLLTRPAPPTFEPPAAHQQRPAPPENPWLRPDVQQLLTRDDGTRVDIASVARCYGREYPARPEPAPADPSHPPIPGAPSHTPNGRATADEAPDPSGDPPSDAGSRPG